MEAGLDLGFWHCILSVMRETDRSDPRRILLVRGVNVGGVKLPMAGFRAMLSGLGMEGVASYLQSGNAVFRAEGDPRGAIAAGLWEGFGLKPALFLYDVPRFRRILNGNPYVEAGRADGAKVHIFFLERPAPEADLDAAMALAAPGEALTPSDEALYFNAPHGMGRSRVAEKLPRLLKVATTARNQRSAEAILALAEAL